MNQLPSPTWPGGNPTDCRSLVKPRWLDLTKNAGPHFGPNIGLFLQYLRHKDRPTDLDLAAVAIIEELSLCDEKYPSFGAFFIS